MTKTEYEKLLKDKIQEVRNFNITTEKKSYHYTQVENLRKLYYSLMELNRFLFDPDNYEFNQYKLNVECKATKKELDKNLNYCLTVIKSHLRKIYSDLEYNLIQF